MSKPLWDVEMEDGTMIYGVEAFDGHEAMENAEESAAFLGDPVDAVAFERVDLEERLIYG